MLRRTSQWLRRLNPIRWASRQGHAYFPETVRSLTLSVAIRFALHQPIHKYAGTLYAWLLTRAANPVRGKEIFKDQCKGCHEDDGQGEFNNELKRDDIQALWRATCFERRVSSAFAAWRKFLLAQRGVID